MLQETDIGKKETAYDCIKDNQRKTVYGKITGI